VAVGLAAGVAAPAAAQQETETVNRTVPLPDKGALRLRNFSGDIRITTGSGRDVVIKAVRRAEREQLDHIKLEIETSGSTVSIEANKRDSSWRDRDNNVVETEFDIQVPAGSRLDVNVFSSDVSVTGVIGEQKVHSFSGTLTLVGVHGPIDAKTFSANIRVEVDGVTEPELQLETFSGDIEARLPGDARGRVRFNSFSGDVQSDLPLMLRSKNRRSLDADLGTGGGRDLVFKTFSGDVTLRR